MSTPSDIAIIGVGLHPFGRYPSKSALEMGEDAVIDALADAGANWDDVDVLWASSMEVKNPEAITGLLGLTGIPARSTFTGCASGGNTLAQAANAFGRVGQAGAGKPPGANGRADQRTLARRTGQPITEQRQVEPLDTQGLGAASRPGEDTDVGRRKALLADAGDGAFTGLEGQGRELDMDGCHTGLC